MGMRRTSTVASTHEEYHRPMLWRKRLLEDSQTRILEHVIAGYRCA